MRVKESEREGGGDVTGREQSLDGASDATSGIMSSVKGVPWLPSLCGLLACRPALGGHGVGVSAVI